MLFLHGYGATYQSFYYQLNYFSKYFKVYAPNLSGFITPLDRVYSLDDYALELDNFIKATKESNFSVVAHSFSARIVLKLCPYNFNKIVITGGAGLKPKRKINYYLKKWGYKSIKALFGQQKANQFSQKYNTNGIENMPINNRLSFIKIVNEHLDYKLKSVNAKTLIINGKSDNQTPLYMAKRFNKYIPSSELVIIEGGHFAFIDNYLKFNIIVRDFLLS